MAKKSRKKSDDLEEIRNYFEKLSELDNLTSDSLKGYIGATKELIKNKKEIESIDEKILFLNNQLANASDEDKEKIKLLIKEEQKRKKLLQDTNKELVKILNTQNLISASVRSIGKTTVKWGKDLLKVQGVWSEVASMQKGIQATEKSMGILSSQASGFRANIQKSSLITNQLGIDAGKLAKMQGSYSEQVGRSVQLSEKGLEAMSEIASGTMLGTEGAAEMAANMERFGVSAEGTRDRIQEMMNLSNKMGVNSVKVTKNLLTNMRLANKFHFKGGVKGMIKLAATAAKLKIDVEDIAGMADKVFRPEGAVEMASKLQVMGGEFAKLADPFKLMYKARNDFEGFVEDIGNATKEFAKFNSETGEFEISGLALDRIKEISNATGISAEKLAEMGRQAAKLEEIQMQTFNLDDENSAFVSSIAKFNESTKQWEVTIDGQTKNINQLKNIEISRIRNEKESLKERAKQAQTFDETWKNLQNTFKTLLLPLFDGISEGLKDPINDFLEWINKKGGLKTLFEMGKSLGKNIGELIVNAKEFIVSIGDFIADNPFTSLITALGGLGLFNLGKWFMNGRILGKGFNSVASVNSGVNSGKTNGGFNFGFGTPFKSAKAGWRGARMKGGNFMQKLAGGTKGFGKGMLKGIGPALIGEIGALGLDYWRNNLEDRDSSGGKALGVGSSALQGAAMGSLFGPWGTLIGGIGGGLYGAYNEFGQKRDFSGYANRYDDVIIRNGEAPIAINPADDILSVKKDGPVDKALGNSSKSNGGDMKISFNPLTINGKIEISNDNTSADLDVNNPILLRDLSKLIQEEIRKAIGGGKLNPNPI